MRHDPTGCDPRGPRSRRNVLARVLALVAVVLTAVAVPAVPTGAAEPSTPLAPAITATPATGLVQGDTVTVAGTGFPGNTLLGVIQCIPGDGVEFCGMNTLTYVNTNASGAFSLGFTPRRILTVAGVDHDCAVAGECRIGVGTVPDGTGGSATAEIQFDPTVPPPPPPTITATPSTDLLDDQSVVVSGEGFDANQYVMVLQCLATAGPDGSGCRYGENSFIQASPAGTFTVNVTVKRVLFVQGVVNDCALPGTCVISAGSGYPGDGPTVPIEFDASVPLPPPPIVTVTPDTDLLDGDTVTVSASGFDDDIPVAVIQCLEIEAEAGSNCNLAAYRTVQTDGAGAFTTDFVVDRILYLADGAVDCAVEACRIVVAALPDGGYPNASVSITFDASVPPPPPPTLVAEPATGLTDGQTITLRGSGYPRNRSLGMAQCLSSEPTSRGCDLSNYKFVTTDDTGSFTTTFTVVSTYDSSSMGFVDCLVAAGHCRIGAGTGENGLGADALLTFSTTGPTTPTTSPGPEVLGAGATAVTPNFTG